MVCYNGHNAGLNMCTVGLHILTCANYTPWSRPSWNRNPTGRHIIMFVLTKRCNSFGYMSMRLRWTKRCAYSLTHRPYYSQQISMVYLLFSEFLGVWVQHHFLFGSLVGMFFPECRHVRACLAFGDAPFITTLAAVYDVMAATCNSTEQDTTWIAHCGI